MLYQAAQSKQFLIGWIAQIFGFILDSLYRFTGIFGIHNVGLCIILFTVVTKLLMLPLTVKQQKFAKISAIMNPELQAVMNKYRGKSDQESMLKMRQEQKEIYEKYGTSSASGCVQLLIQFPIIIALYNVVRNIPSYVDSVRVYFVNIIDSGLFSNIGIVKEYVATNKDVSVNLKALAEASNKESAIDALNKFSTQNWNTLQEIFTNSGNSDIVSAIVDNSDNIIHMNRFFGIDLAANPTLTSISVIIPILAALSQWVSFKLAENRNNKRQGKVKEPEYNPMASMNIIMPALSAVFCLSMPAAIGIYWIAQAIVQAIIQIFVNRYFDSRDINDIIKANIEKANQKRAKQGLPPKNISTNANLKSNSNHVISDKSNNEKKAQAIKESTEYYNSTGKKGSIAAKAAMVAKYNEKNKK